MACFCGVLSNAAYTDAVRFLALRTKRVQKASKHAPVWSSIVFGRHTRTWSGKLSVQTNLYYTIYVICRTWTGNTIHHPRREPYWKQGCYLNTHNHRHILETWRIAYTCIQIRMHDLLICTRFQYNFSLCNSSVITPFIIIIIPYYHTQFFVQ